MPATKAVFDDYEIHGVRAFGEGDGRHFEQVPDAEADIWTLFGHIPNQGLEAIGDFQTRELAEEVLYRIAGPTAPDERSRLMQAAPKLLNALWAALPFVESWSEWVYACEDYGERSDAIDRQHGRMLEAYGEATGISKEAVRITLTIERLMQSDYFVPDEMDASKVRAELDRVPDGFAPVVGDAWAGLTAEHQDYALRHHVNWSGFGQSQVEQVIRNVIGGEPKERWLTGGKPQLPTPAEVIANPAAYLPEPVPGNDNDHGNER